MKKTLLTIFTMLGLALGTLTAQETTPFKPSGTPEALIFTDFNNVSVNSKSMSKFEITRAYFGYKYNFSENWSGRVTMDFGNPGVGALNYTAYIKYGYVQFKQKNLTVKFGLIQNTMYEMLETYWGSRYIYKSFQDQYGFAGSADFGASAAYKFNNVISADVMIENGEGYKVLNTDSVMKEGIGITIHPISSITIRGYYDNMKKVNSTVNQSATSLMAGYESKKFKIAAEYNYQKNNKLVRGNNWGGYSFYGNLFFNAKTDLFLRYDLLQSSNSPAKATSWNYAKDGSIFMAGLEFVPVKGVRIAPNYQLWTPRDASKNATSSVFMNVEIKF